MCLVRISGFPRLKIGGFNMLDGVFNCAQFLPCEGVFTPHFCRDPFLPLPCATFP